MSIQPVSQWSVPSDRLYDTHHQWYIREGDVVTIGITDYTQDTAGDILYYAVPQLGEQVKAGQPFGSLESGKWVGQLYSPFNGVVVEVNSQLEGNPGLLNQDCYGSGWLIKVRPTQDNSLNGLLTPELYSATLPPATDPSIESSTDNNSSTGENQ